MRDLNLTAKGAEQELILAYLKENASEVLADKINNGVPVEKDGKTLISKKNLDGFMSYACSEAQKQAEKGARGACIEDKTVYGWAIHYFEENSIEGTLYNADGTEYKPPKPVKKTTTPAVPYSPPAPKPKPQMSLFDLMEENSELKEAAQPTPAETPEPVTAETIDEKIPPAADNGEDDDQPSDEEIREIMAELAEQEAEEQAAVQVETPKEQPKGSPLYQRYMQIQDRYPDAIVALRLGDFYEVLGENAVTVADELNLTLTGRDCGLENRVPMVGFPYHAADRYFQKICENRKLAIVESTGETRLLEMTEPEIVDAVDPETGEILTEAEMRKFDGDIQEPKNLQTAADDALAYERNIAVSFDSVSVCKLSDLIGDIFIVR